MVIELLYTSYIVSGHQQYHIHDILTKTLRKTDALLRVPIPINVYLSLQKNTNLSPMLHPKCLFPMVFDVLQKI